MYVRFVYTRELSAYSEAKCTYSNKLVAQTSQSPVSRVSNPQAVCQLDALELATRHRYGNRRYGTWRSFRLSCALKPGKTLYAMGMKASKKHAAA